ncbi:hypothetical protein Droror1_Dr00001448 [Drosera rotundifolia]
MTTAPSTPTNHRHRLRRLPLSGHIDAVRFLPPLSPFDSSLIISLFDPSTASSSLHLCHSLSTSTTRRLISCPSRATSMKTAKLGFHDDDSIMVAYSCFDQSIRFVILGREYEVREEMMIGGIGGDSIHEGEVTAIDVREGGEGECVSVGEDGRVNVVGVREGGGVWWRKVVDAGGLVGYGAVKWGSGTEVVTGGMGFGVQWWDLRKPGDAVLQFKGNWPHKSSSGIVHSIDIHPSRKHICLAGGSSGTIFAWDLRWQKQPIILSGPGVDRRLAHPVSESDIWEVQFDSYSHSSQISNFSSSRMLPVMMCSEDGILASIEQGLEPVELLAEPCAINSFDIDKQNNMNVVCSLEWESIAILTRT